MTKKDKIKGEEEKIKRRVKIKGIPNKISTKQLEWLNT